MHLLLWLLYAHNHWMRLQGDCRVCLLLPRRHALLSARAVVALLLPLLLLLLRWLELYLLLWLLHTHNHRLRL